MSEPETQMPHSIVCRGRVPINCSDPWAVEQMKGRDLGRMEARLDSYCEETEEVKLRLDALHSLEFWAEPRFTLQQLKQFLLEEYSLELSWKPADM